MSQILRVWEWELRMRMRVLTEKLRVEIENAMRVFLDSLNFEIEMRVSQKSAIDPPLHSYMDRNARLGVYHRGPTFLKTIVDQKQVVWWIVNNVKWKIWIRFFRRNPMGYFMSSGLTTRAKWFLKMLKMLKSGQNLQAKRFYDFFSKCCHSKTNTDNDMKPKLVES